MAPCVGEGRPRVLVFEVDFFQNGGNMTEDLEGLHNAFNEHLDKLIVEFGLEIECLKFQQSLQKPRSQQRLKSPTR